MSKIRCWFGLHHLEHCPYGKPVAPFTLPRWVCRDCGKVKYRLTGEEQR